MNLVDDTWIPVIGSDGKSRLVGLAEVFRNGEHIADLAANPCQRIALTRLLLCVAQAALDGPSDEDDWLACRNRIAPAALAYLEKWHDRFNLFGEGAFLQVDGLEDKPNTLADKLDFGLASGNNPTLFDHAATPAGRMTPKALLATNLLVYQMFSPGGLIGSIAWEGRETARSSEHAPCLEGSMLHTLMRGPTLMESLHWNLLTQDQITTQIGAEWGAPCWEAQSLSSKELTALSLTYLGRLVTVPRSIRCKPGSSVEITLADGIRYPKFPDYREPSATVRIIKRGGVEVPAYLPVNPAKHPWRDLGAMLALRVADQKGGPLVFDHIRTKNTESTFDIWTGGLAAEKAKLIDMAEWTLSLPPDLLDSRALNTYQEGVNWAELGNQALRRGIKTYAEYFHGEAVWAQNAQRQYWTRLDGRCNVLCQSAHRGDGGLHSEWLPIIRSAMRQAYARVCPHETPRQIEAYALGWGILEAWKPASDGGADA